MTLTRAGRENWSLSLSLRPRLCWAPGHRGGRGHWGHDMMSCNNIIDDIYNLHIDPWHNIKFNWIVIVNTPKKCNVSCLVVICLVLTFQVIFEWFWMDHSSIGQWCVSAGGPWLGCRCKYIVANEYFASYFLGFRPLLPRAALPGHWCWAVWAGAMRCPVITDQSEGEELSCDMWWCKQESWHSWHVYMACLFWKWQTSSTSLGSPWTNVSDIMSHQIFRVTECLRGAQ